MSLSPSLSLLPLISPFPFPLIPPSSLELKRKIGELSVTRRKEQEAVLPELKKMNARTTQALWTNWQVLHCKVYFAALYCSVLYCTVLYVIALCCRVPHYTILYVRIVCMHCKLYFPIPSHRTLSQSTPSLPTSSHPTLSHPTPHQRTSPSISSSHLTSSSISILSS
jgi:hypothetical protein